ncbi:hypothetical protein LTR53_016540 [Teratosphaeriaceae sp. CCFEE 6253]|nr:hypothetical protein LTR53_016540 [Teratosphaeriaceae sp. CCFEE 6253]
MSDTDVSGGVAVREEECHSIEGSTDSWRPEDMFESPMCGPENSLSPTESSPSADESTALIKRHSDDDCLSDTSLEGLEAAAVEYLISGGHSYSRAADVHHAHKRLRLATTMETHPRKHPADRRPATPVSPYREFSAILAERRTRSGTLYKVVWRDSWVSQAKMPEIEKIRQAHMARYGVSRAVETDDEGWF